MKAKVQPWLWALIFLILAGATRFARLGDWSFAGDEGYTKVEVATLTTPSVLSPDMNIVPKVIPLSFLLHDVGCRWFGSDEFGSRLMSCIIGTLSVPMIVLLLWPSVGSRTSTIVGLILVLWPEHLFQSQQFRFYSFAFFFTSTSLCIGLLSLQKQSICLLLCSCAVGALAILSHTICAPLFGVLFLAEAANSIKSKKWNWNRFLIIILANLSVFADYFFRVKPLAGDMSKAEFWSPSSLYGIQSGIQLVGWPTFLFTMLGALKMMLRRISTDWFWFAGMVLWGIQAVALPKLLPFHADYLFPLALVMIVPAVLVIEYLASLLYNQSKLLAYGFIGIVVLLPLPSVTSYYCDGNRYDFRSAGAYVSEQSHSTDRYAGVNCTVLNQYLPQDAENINCPEAVNKLKELRKQSGRIWIVVTRGRNPLPEDLAMWLREHATLKKQIRKQRFDYYEYVVDVYVDEGK